MLTDEILARFIHDLYRFFAPIYGFGSLPKWEEVEDKNRMFLICIAGHVLELIKVWRLKAFKDGMLDFPDYEELIRYYLNSTSGEIRENIKNISRYRENKRNIANQQKNL